MPSLKDIVRAAHGMAETADLPDEAPGKNLPDYVLPRHYAWMDLPESKRQWSAEALQYAADVMSGKFKHKREARFSPSGIGSNCQREILFSYAGAPKKAFPLLNQEKMDSGTFEHLRWQMEGLSAGYMASGEVWVFNEGMMMGGSADARLADGSLFELKNTSGHLFNAAYELKKPAKDRRKLTTSDYFEGMHRKHLMQMEAYWECDRLTAAAAGTDRIFSDYGSLVYQDTGTRASLEFRIKSNPERLAELHAYVEGLHDWVFIDQLPDMLDGCRKATHGVDGAEMLSEKELTVYRRCPYRDHCPSASTVTVR